jgi:dihydropyrimidine dehydrogenase (NADP+)
MVHGYGLASELASGLSGFMLKKGFHSVADFKGLALPHVTSHSELVSRQKAAVAAKKEKQKAVSGGGLAPPKKDDEWSGEGDDFVRQSDAMVAE